MWCHRKIHIHTSSGIGALIICQVVIRVDFTMILDAYVIRNSQPWQHVLLWTRFPSNVLASVPTQQHEGYGYILVCSGNSGLDCKQRLGNRYTDNNLPLKLARWSLSYVDKWHEASGRLVGPGSYCTLNYVIRMGVLVKHNVLLKPLGAKVETIYTTNSSITTAKSKRINSLGQLLLEEHCSLINPIDKFMPNTISFI